MTWLSRPPTSWGSPCAFQPEELVVCLGPQHLVRQKCLSGEGGLWAPNLGDLFMKQSGSSKSRNLKKCCINFLFSLINIRVYKPGTKFKMCIKPCENEGCVPL